MNPILWQALIRKVCVCGGRVVEDERVCVAGSRAHEGLLDTGLFCGDAQLAEWYSRRYVPGGEARVTRVESAVSGEAGAATSGSVDSVTEGSEGEYVCGGGVDVVGWRQFRVRLWAVLVVGISVEDVEKLALDGGQLEEMTGPELGEQLALFGMSEVGVKALVSAHQAKKWGVTREVGPTVRVGTCDCVKKAWQCTGDAWCCAAFRPRRMYCAAFGG